MKDIFNSKLFRFLVTAFALIYLYHHLHPDYWWMFLVMFILFWIFYQEPKETKSERRKRILIRKGWKHHFDSEKNLDVFTPPRKRKRKSRRKSKK